jgi:hypothetical protein
MPATFEKLGVRFLYPENWRLTDETDTELPCSVSLETPSGDAFWSIHLFPLDADQDEILKETVNSLRETYPDLEVASRPPDFDRFPGTAIETLFYCLDFLIRVRLQVFQTADYQLMFWFQAEDREFDKQEPIFKAMATSVLAED